MTADLYKCPKCKDTGFIEHVREDGSRSYTYCECRKKEEINKLWNKSGIKDLSASFKKFERWNEASTELYNTAVNYYKNFENIKNDRNNSIMFCGQPGSGKTYISLALANNFIKQKTIEVVYMPYRDTVTEIKQILIDKENYKKTVDKLQKAEILLIDDLFKGKINETDINIIFEIVNYRYINNLPLIVSTELTVDKLLQIDEAIGSRLYEMCKGHVVEIQGMENNYRLR